MKKSLILVAASCFTLGLAACSSDNTPSGVGGSSSGGGGAAGIDGSATGTGGVATGTGGVATGTGGSATSTGDGGFTVTVSPTCTNAADCPTTQICCAGLDTATITITTACQASPCMLLPGANMALQFCAVTSECPSGQVCASPPAAAAAQAPALASYKFCSAPSDGG